MHFSSISSTLFNHLSTDIVDRKHVESDRALFYFLGHIAWIIWSYSKKTNHSDRQWNTNGVGIINSYSIFMHALSGFIMWNIGFFQFRMSAKGSYLHKSLGWIYLFCAIIASISGIILSFHEKFTSLTQYILIIGSIHISLRVMQSIYFIKQSNMIKHQQMIINQWKHSHVILFHRPLCELIQKLFIPDQPMNAINYAFFPLIIGDLYYNTFNYLDIYLRIIVLIICTKNQFHIDHNLW